MNGTGHTRSRVPVIDLAEVSAGGGSIAWVDRASERCASARRAPRRQPRPGLAYERAPRADCHRLRPPARLPGQALAARRRARHRSRGRRSRRPHPARRAARRRSCATAAAAVIDVVNHAMAEVLKIVSVQRGHDPRDFVLAAFGEQGRCMPPRWRRARHCRGDLPADPGRLFALGLVGTDLRRDYVQTLFTLAEDCDPATLEAAFRRVSSARVRHARPRRHRGR